MTNFYTPQYFCLKIHQNTQIKLELMFFYSFAAFITTLRSRAINCPLQTHFLTLVGNQMLHYFSLY